MGQGSKPLGQQVDRIGQDQTVSRVDETGEERRRGGGSLGPTTRQLPLCYGPVAPFSSHCLCGVVGGTGAGGWMTSSRGPTLHVP